MLTGAASRGKSGKYFHYYKCRFSKHLNVSAKKAHEQFESILELMSLPAAEITKIRASARKEVKQELDNNMKRLAQKKSELEAEKTLLYSIEEKYIKNEIDQDTYRRWSDVYKEKIDVLETAVLRFGNTSNEGSISWIDEWSFFQTLSTINRTPWKERVIDLFDSKLYYEMSFIQHL